MKAFEFSLRKSLDARMAQEKAAEIALGKALRKQKECERCLARIMTVQRRYVAISTEMAGRRVTSSQLLALAAFLEDLQARLQSSTEALDEACRAVSQARSLLLDKVRDRKVMEQLQARERQRWLVEARRIERRDMDEIAAVAFARRRVAG